MDYTCLGVQVHCCNVKFLLCERSHRLLNLSYKCVCTWFSASMHTVQMVSCGWRHRFCKGLTWWAAVCFISLAHKETALDHHGSQDAALWERHFLNHLVNMAACCQIQYVKTDYMLHILIKWKNKGKHIFFSFFDELCAHYKHSSRHRRMFTVSDCNVHDLLHAHMCTKHLASEVFHLIAV